MEWKPVLIKAVTGALQGAVAELVLVRIVDEKTLYAALALAVIRGGIAFLSEIVEAFQPVPVAGSVPVPRKVSFFREYW